MVLRANASIQDAEYTRSFGKETITTSHLFNHLLSSFDTNQQETNHGSRPLCRQIRGVLREEVKEQLKHFKPATYCNKQLQVLDTEMYHKDIRSDETIKKIR